MVMVVIRVVMVVLDRGVAPGMLDVAGVDGLACQAVVAVPTGTRRMMMVGGLTPACVTDRTVQEVCSDLWRHWPCAAIRPVVHAFGVASSRRIRSPMPGCR